jgi:hypothetical protein
MRTVYKYHLLTQDAQTIELPRGAEYLTVQMQHDRPTIWALVDTNAPTERHTVRVVGTGNPIERDALAGMRYLGTVQEKGWPSFVWHIFVPVAA